MEKIETTIIGAGIVGLAVSAAVAKPERTVYVLEKNLAFGQETSSRNSEVIHAGLYYPRASLKALGCVEGNRLIYELCAKNNISCQRTGKLVVANEPQEMEELNVLFNTGQGNGAKDLAMLKASEIKKLEPNIQAKAALHSPNTGIVDSHNLMRCFFQKAKAQGAQFVFGATLTKIEKQKDGYQLTVRDADGSDFSFWTRIVINCAGLNSDLIAAKAGIDIQAADYVLKFCKGEYFRVASSKSRLIKRLVYPVPEKKEISLGIHATPDLGGGLRLGPDAQYIARDQANYELNQSKKDYFAQAARRFLPFVESADLSADTAGIRPKLQGPDDGFRDFVIRHEEDRGLAGLINLIGIDSPGLTASPWIANYVRAMVEKII